MARTSVGQKPVNGVVFVVCVLILWYVFAVLAQVIVIAVPALPVCLQQGQGLACAFPWQYVPLRAANPTRTDWVVLILALLGALWAASRWVYPPENFDQEKKAKRLAQPN
jgi:hypothetical protein